MGLVGYSDSEGSDDESAVVTETQTKKDASSKRNFQKVVDRANPTRIRVNLQDTPAEKPAGEDSEDGPPSKKKKLGGGGLMGGFNSMLPAPKRTNVSAAGNAGLRKGVSLKTGAAPGFTREPMEPSAMDVDSQGDLNGAESEEVGSHAPITQPMITSTAEPPAEPTLKGKVTMFKPLSVARKPQKPKKKTETVSKESAGPKSDAAISSASTTTPAPKPKPKVSLFSSYTEDEPPATSTDSNGDYQPMLYQSESAAPEASEYAPELPAGRSAPQTQTDKQSLDTIASDLNLSYSMKRQLFGRAGKGAAAAAKITTFDMDAEYNANEELRANQEVQEVRKPVTIQPGRHNLRQLVNAAVGQKEALEEHYAAGRRNKKEAGSKYGW